MLNGLDLFTGIGGFALGLEDWVRPVAYVERDPYCVSVLLERMREGQIPCAPICTDIRELRGDMFEGKIDIITAGFPCQDVSVAGLRKGLGGERTKLFWEVVRLAKETSAPFIFLENVQGISKHVPVIRDAFEKLGYSCRDGFLSASDVGANHKRARWFLLAYADNSRYQKWKEPESPRQQKKQHGSLRLSETMADADGKRWSKSLQRQVTNEKKFARFSSFVRVGEWWSVEPNVGRVVNGLPFRVDRIKALGNSLVPAQARRAFMILAGKLGES